MVRAGTVVWLGANPEGRFIDIELCDRLPLVRGQSDLHGAIELEINGVDVLDRDLTDEIVTMWIYVSQMVHDYMHERPATAALPGQAILVSLTPLPRGLVRISVDGEPRRRTAVADAADLLSAFRFAGNQFFDKIEELTGRFWPKARTLLNTGSESR